jgi:hypothetical protein
LNEIRRPVGPTRRAAILAAMGYVKHPILNGGRVNNIMLAEGGKKPVLYVKAGHLSTNLKRAVDVQTSYEDAQKKGA